MDTKENGRKRRTRKFVEFWCGTEQQEAFDRCKRAILKNEMTGGDHHLFMNASKTGAGGYLFQLADTEPGEWAMAGSQGKDLPVMYLSFQFLTAETKYYPTEREALSVLNCLKEV